jgi:uncharacterized protein (DUF1800 family)
MATATASAAFVAKRRLFSALFASAGASPTDPRLSLRRPGRDGLLEPDLPASPDALTFPIASVRWLSRATCGFTTSDHGAFTALGATDEARWAAWLAQQLDPATIVDSACDARLAGAGFTTLNKTAAQLWAAREAVGGSNYFQRMLPIAETECATLIRRIYSKRQLFEVMAEFWHDHFSVFGWDYDGGPMFPAFDRDAIRPHVFGNFRSMLQATCESASMMYMLDLYGSVAGHPNENYARELLELHTLGAENYAGIVSNPDSFANMNLLGHFTAWNGEEERLRYVDDDVYEAARALSGWTISGSNWWGQIGTAPLGTFAYDDARHDQSTKHILAQYFTPYQAQGDGTFLFDMLAQHPGTAHFVAGKICRRFVGDSPSTALVQAAADIFHQQWQAPDQLRQVVEFILQSDEFKTTWGTKMKRPAASVVSALRALGADFTPVPDNTATYTPTEELVGRLQAAGQRLFYWPAPNGYPDTQAAWSCTGTLGLTLKLLPRLLEMHQVESYNNAQPFLADVQGQTLAYFTNAADRTAANIIGYWCDRLLGQRPQPTYGVALDFLRQEAAATAPLDLTSDSTDAGQPAHTGVWHLNPPNTLSQHYTIARLRVAIGLILCSPDFLRR